MKAHDDFIATYISRVDKKKKVSRYTLKVVAPLHVSDVTSYEYRISSKCRRIAQPTHPNKRRPRNLAAWYGVDNDICMRTRIQIGLLLKLCKRERRSLARRSTRNLPALELSPHGTAP